MKTRNLIYICLISLLFVLVSCKKEYVPWEPGERNVGEEILNVNVNSLNFLQEGGKAYFTVSSTYDGVITADRWFSVDATEFPGDGTVFTITVTAPENTLGVERNGKITVTTRSLKHEITVSQNKM